MLLQNNTELQDFSAILYSVIKIPILVIDENGLALFKIADNEIENPINDNREAIFSDIISRSREEFPRTYSSEYLENFLALTVSLPDGQNGFMILGPSIAHVIDESIDSVINRRMSAKEKSLLIKYYKLLPVINYHELIKHGIFIHYILHKEKIDLDSINTADSALQNFHLKIENEYNIQYRDLNYLHRSSFFERHFYSLIKNGETDKLKKLLSVHSLDGEYIVLAKNNPLRSWKNLVICFITISCRAAMEGGLATETTYAISDVFIQKLEELNRIKDVEDLANKVFIDLADRVNSLKKMHYSKLVTRALNYISKNMDKTLTLAQISEQLDVNGSYLSNAFKTEVGISVTEYIMKEKISEAKRMLLFTQFSILDISTALNFYDQSHFTKVFKKFTDQSPKQFRNEHSSSTLWY